MTSEQTFGFNTVVDQLLQSLISSGGDSPLERFRKGLSSLEPPELSEDHPINNLAFAILVKEADYSLRYKQLEHALDLYKRKTIEAGTRFADVDSGGVVSEAAKISTSFVLGVEEVSRVYPSKSQHSHTLQEQLFQILLPDKKSTHEQLVSALVLYELFEPFLIVKLLELDVKNPSLFREQIASLAASAQLLQGFYNSIAHALSYTVTGEASIGTDEIINRLFDLGPLFVKMMQVFQGSGLVKAGTASRQELLEEVGTHFQEGIRPATEEEQETIAANLPPGLEYADQISSASVAHVVKTRSASGVDLATKVLRPNIRETIDDNTRLYNLLSEILIAFVQAHAEEGTLASQLPRWKKAIPFFLEFVQSGIIEELDLTSELASQQRAYHLFNEIEGVRVPQPYRQHSDAHHLSMEVVMGRRISELPANPKIIRSMIRLVVSMWKNRFWHGDMHQGNVKVDETGNLVLYDWGKTIDIKPGLLNPVKRLISGIIRGDARIIATAYCQAQDSKYTQITYEQALSAAHDVLQENGKQDKRAASRLPYLTQTLQTLLVTIGLRYQSTINASYLTFIRSSLELYLLAKSELNKPEYKGWRNKVRCILIGLKD